MQLNQRIVVTLALGVAVASAATAQTSQHPGAPIRVLLDEPNAPPPPAQKPQPAPIPQQPQPQPAPRPVAPVQQPRPAPAPMPAQQAPAAPAPRPAPTPPPRVERSEPVRTSRPPSRPKKKKAAAAPVRSVKPAPRPAPAAAAKPAPKPHGKPKRMPPFPDGPEPGKPESYRRKIEAWRDLLEEQRVAWGGGTYPEYRRALRKYQRGVDKYLAMIGRPRDPSEVPSYPAPKPKPKGDRD